jgi:DNA polymerase-1
MAPYLDPRLEVPLVLLEGEIDALSVAQECRGIVSAVATGSTEGSRIGKWKVWITIRKLIFVAFDADDKGDKAAAWWLHRLHDGRRLRPLWDDANQMLQDGVDLFNNWIQPELESILYGPSPLPIPDGIWRCHACQKPFPTFEGWEIEKIPAGEVVSYDPVEGNPYCKQCRPDLFEGVVLSSDGAEASIYSIPYLTTVGQVQTLAESLEANATYVLDLETTGLNPRKNKVISIALGTADRVSVIDVRGFYAATEEEQGQWKEALQRLLHRDDITWAGHNLKFDWSFLAVHFGVRLRKVYDTILVERLLHSKKGKDRGFFRLDTVAQRYGLEVSKEARNWFVDLDQRPEEWQAVLPAEQVTYIEQDIRIPHKLLAHQQKAIEAVDLGRVTALENGALPTIAAMEIKGVAVDVERWKGILHIQRTRHTELTALLKQVLGDALADQEESQDEGRLFTVRPERPDIKLTSADQLMKALQALGIPVYGTSQGALEEVRGVHEVISQLLEWKKIQKSLSAFGESFLKRVQDDGRIHATFDQLGADSGRMSCREPNLQQMPKPKDDDTNIRSCFVAPQGHKLLVADLSNIELRILAEASQDQTMLRFFAEGKDLHAETARMMFKLGDALTADEIKGMKAPGGYKYRDAAKTINFGLAYGMGPGRLANRLGIEVEAARQLMQAYFATYKGVDGYLKRTGRAGVKDGYAVTLAGRRRTFERDLLSNPAKRGGVERAAKNHPIQGTNADILKRALALLFERLPKNVHVVLTVHDEIVLETPIDTLEVAEKHLKESMMDACRDFLKRVAVPEPDVLIAEYWVKG